MTDRTIKELANRLYELRVGCDHIEDNADLTEIKNEVITVGAEALVKKCGIAAGYYGTSATESFSFLIRKSVVGNEVDTQEAIDKILYILGQEVGI